MGQCGCSESYPEFKLKGPDGIYYTVEVAYPCPYCRNPASIIVHKWDDKQDIEIFDIESEPDPVYNSLNEVVISLADEGVIKNYLLQGLKEYIQGIKDDGDQVSYDDIKEWINMAFDDNFDDMIMDSYDKAKII